MFSFVTYICKHLYQYVSVETQFKATEYIPTCLFQVRLQEMYFYVYSVQVPLVLTESLFCTRSAPLSMRYIWLYCIAPATSCSCHALGNLKSIVNVSQTIRVHRCGIGGSIRACHAAGSGSIPVGTSFLAEVFRGFYSPVRRMSGSFRPIRSSNIIWPSSSSIIISLRAPMT